MSQEKKWGTNTVEPNVGKENNLQRAVKAKAIDHTSLPRTGQAIYDIMTNEYGAKQQACGNTYLKRLQLDGDGTGKLPDRALKRTNCKIGLSEDVMTMTVDWMAWRRGNSKRF